MSRDYYSPTYVLITVDQARRAVDSLDHLIKTELERGHQLWAVEAVRGALYALSTGTDCIVTDPMVLENDDE